MLPQNRKAKKDQVQGREAPVNKRHGKNKLTSSVSPPTLKKENKPHSPCVGEKLPTGGREGEKPPLHMGRRSSSRLKNRNSTGSSGKSLMADSAYDGDGESSPSTSQSEGDDPYSLSAMEEVPVVARAGRKKRSKVVGLRKTTANVTTNKRGSGGSTHVSSTSTKVESVSKRASTVSAHTSSTPNLTSQDVRRRSTRRSPSLTTTPEVTPILPVKPSLEVLTPVEVSLSTPHLYTKTRPSPLISSSSMQSSSQGDSGIALSPPAKRARVQHGEPRHKTAAVLGKKFMNKRNIFSPNSKQANVLPDTRESMDTSCFGFSSMDSLDKPASGVKRKLPSTAAYRSSQPTISDSSPSRPLDSTDSENWPDVSQRQWLSPGLFSDDIFSADSESLAVNKSTSRTYRPCKVQKLKQPKSMSKFEAWANEKNMEIEDIEKFDLNIE